ncbi:MAG: YitT family protein [Tabrizicola sp.]|uniref:YitT family protein n=1 Tax=Tabrizicola sp. TaxID=2005166 RepID=UPI0027323C39|nr:YitT family protein [Tabrizicola sp.]MDP3263493.1 YitT family protein [Tabrizicola sp.]MDP3646850.1 YitT family protein [Paracoccaceae bacterium]MDZ4069581.1 YitT family protein [Tabrizicola sp.]
MTHPARHTMIEDAQGLTYGTIMAAVAIVLLTHLGLVTGQTAGLAVLISYATGWSFGAVFFVVNIPFYYLGYRRMGLAFTVKTFLSVAALSSLTLWLPAHLQFGAVNPWLGAVIFGLMSGSALLALFRHGASLGGIGILGLILQDRFGWRAGWVQLAFDAVLFAAALTILDARAVAVSFVGAVVINLVIAINHRRDRYITT